jgi:hypothetical protein
MPLSRLADLLDLQSGVVSRAQVLDIEGESDATVRRRVRRNEWAVVHPGVYINHTGPLTWLQRAWAAVLLAAPAALSHDSALRAADGPGKRERLDSEPIHVAVDRDRVIRVPGAVVLHRLADFDTKTQTNCSPPRVRVEEAVLDVAAEARSDLDAIAALSDAVRARRTTAPRLLVALAGRSRIGRRELLSSVLADVAAGTCSALEREYLAKVERPHGLPTADRQVRVSRKGTLYRDVEYAKQGLVVELDGRLFHSEVRDRDRDLDRDLDAAVDGRDTVRLGWGQVHVRSCSTAARVGAVLANHGWTGALTRCPSCPTEDSGDLQSPGDCDSPLSA